MVCVRIKFPRKMSKDLNEWLSCALYSDCIHLFDKLKENHRNYRRMTYIVLSDNDSLWYISWNNAIILWIYDKGLPSFFTILAECSITCTGFFVDQLIESSH